MADTIVVLKKFTRRDSFADRFEFEKMFQDHYSKNLKSKSIVRITDSIKNEIDIDALDYDRYMPIIANPGFR